MSYYWSLIGPLALALAAAVIRQNLDTRWHRWIAAWVTVDFLTVSLLVLHGILLGEWRAIFIATANFVALTSAWDSVYWLKEHPSVTPNRYYIWFAVGGGDVDCRQDWLFDP